MRGHDEVNEPFREWCDDIGVPRLAKSILEVAEHCLDFDRKRRRSASRQRRGSPDGYRDGFDELIPLGLSNTFGITGPRGSGKSTVMADIGLHLEKVGFRLWHPEREGEGQTCIHIISRPLDCTVLPDQLMDPGAAVLLQIKNAIDRVNSSHRRQLNIEAAEAIGELLGRYSQIDRTYRDLCADLSATPDDFGRYVSEGVERRLGLGERLHETLEQLLNEMRCDALLIKLDDFDLVSGSYVRQWYRALLDELRQPRLLFLLTADFHRLGYLSTDDARQIDDLTGRRLVGKLLPVQNRLDLPALDSARRRCFKPLFRQRFDEPASLENLLTDALAEQPQPILAVVAGLLPSLPRSAVDLYESLRDEASIELDRLLVLLAECRNEPLFARTLQERHAEMWLGELYPEIETPPVEVWTRSVAAASERVRNASKASPGTIEIMRPRARTPVDEKVQLMRWQDDLARPPHWRAPIRHDDLYRAVLRDARSDDWALWCELLVDRAVGDARTGGSHRSWFLDRWTPVSCRFHNARFELPMSRAELRLMATQPHTRGAGGADHRIELQHLFGWIRLSPEQAGAIEGAELRVEIGWPVLFDATRGARPAIPYELLRRAGTGPDRLVTLPQRLPTPPAPGVANAPDQAGELLPGAVWAMVLLADALDRAPWRAVSEVRRLWKPVTYIGLAAAYVHTAYVWVLRTCGASSVPNGPALRDQLLTHLDRTAAPSFAVDERAIHHGLGAFFRHAADHPTPATPPPQAPSGPHRDDVAVIHRALHAFEQLPAWTELAHLPWDELVA